VQSDISDIYLLAKKTTGVFVNIALQEPFGLTLIEAAVHGCPIVATTHGGPVDIIKTLKVLPNVAPVLTEILCFTFHVVTQRHCALVDLVVSSLLYIVIVVAVFMLLYFATCPVTPPLFVVH
jgi:glycosyltransferase involved in cell wall biosynthesis